MDFVKGGPKGVDDYPKRVGGCKLWTVEMVRTGPGSEPCRDHFLRTIFKHSEETSFEILEGIDKELMDSVQDRSLGNVTVKRDGSSEKTVYR